MTSSSNFGKWMALAAALLGWLFDGLEMGLFPLVARPALSELGVPSANVANWLGIITALFLVGAATGGVFFGWLGDRIGRVRSMMLSVLTYAIVSGLGGFATEAWHIGALRFFAALGMGGEWSLGVALINEIWPDRSRAFLAGLIGAAANVGYLIIALVGRGLTQYVHETKELLVSLGVSDSWVDYLMGQGNTGWRLLMMLAALPALLTFFIRIFVPESHRWESERARGATSHWANRDLLAVLVGCAGACGIIFLWAEQRPVVLQISGTLLGLALVTVGYLFPVFFYLKRSMQASLGVAARAESSVAPASAIPGESPPLSERELQAAVRPAKRWGLLPTTSSNAGFAAPVKLMLLAACLSGVALLGTWGSIQQGPSWAAEIAPDIPTARSDIQIWSSIGAIAGTILAALVADMLGRRVTYTLLCALSMIIIPALFLLTTPRDPWFIPVVFLSGAITASFYGWLPLYLPELFPTSIRATGQGFGFNFGRVLAAIGVLQLGNLKALFEPYGWGLGEVCSMLSGIYVVGMILIWFAPETKGKPLPE